MQDPRTTADHAPSSPPLDFALTAVFLHSGRVCSAGARLVVESVHDEFVDALVAGAGRIRVGGQLDEKAETGPLASAQHRDKVEAYVARGVAEGDVLLCGRRRDAPALADGIYCLPMILNGCSSDTSVTQAESFGPVLSVETFRGPCRSPDSIYGLTGAVWTQEAGKGQRVRPAPDGHGLDQRLPPP